MACTVYKMPLGKSDQEECDTGDHVPLLSVTTLANCAAVCMDDLSAERAGLGHCSTPLCSASQNHVRPADGGGALEGRHWKVCAHLSIFPKAWLVGSSLLGVDHEDLCGLCHKCALGYMLRQVNLKSFALFFFFFFCFLLSFGLLES